MGVRTPPLQPFLSGVFVVRKRGGGWFNPTLTRFLVIFKVVVVVEGGFIVALAKILPFVFRVVCGKVRRCSSPYQFFLRVLVVVRK